MARPQNFKIRSTNEGVSARVGKGVFLQDFTRAVVCPKCLASEKELIVTVTQYGLFDSVKEWYVYACADCKCKYFEETVWRDGVKETVRPEFA